MKRLRKHRLQRRLSRDVSPPRLLGCVAKETELLQALCPDRAKKERELRGGLAYTGTNPLACFTVQTTGSGWSGSLGVCLPPLASPATHTAGAVGRAPSSALGSAGRRCLAARYHREPLLPISDRRGYRGIGRGKRRGGGFRVLGCPKPASTLLRWSLAQVLEGDKGMRPRHRGC